MSNTHDFDVVVIGGGPAGMMAAGHAALRGFRVCLLEKNSVLGKKLSITGGGRCNITNAEFDVKALLKNFKEAEPFLYSPFAQFGVQSTFDFFTSRGLPIITEDRKRAFPKSEKAADVTRVMETFVRNAGVTVHTSTSVYSIQATEGQIHGVLTNNGTYTARAYIIASGGTSRPETGSTGDAVSWLEQLGHTVQKSDPDLVPLIVKNTWITNLSGTTLADIGITFGSDAEQVRRVGNVLCTHFGLSGPLILNSARQVKVLLKAGPVSGKIDLFPHDDVGMLRKKFQDVCVEHSNKTVVNMLAFIIPKSVVPEVLREFPSELREQKVHSVTKDVRHALVDQMKNLQFTVTGTKGLEWAIVSDGGVDLKEINTKTMQSRLHKNVYVVGDMLNIPRPSGGYSLQLCWTTGWVAGNHVCDDLPKG